MPYLGNEPAVAYTSTTKDTFSGDASTTDFTLSKAGNNNALRVVVENVVQDPGVAYTCVGTTLSFTSAPPTGTNNIYVVHLGPPAATVAPPSTINNATTFTSNVTLKSEVPEDTDGGRGRGIDFQGTQSGGEVSKLAQILASHDGTADDEKGKISFKTNDGNDSNSPTERWRITSDGNFKAMVNGYGIDFSATEGSGASSSVLDDYEQGTWTPTLLDGADASQAISGISAEYTKIGDQVFVYSIFTRNNTTGTNGTMNIGGLPYAGVSSRIHITGHMWMDLGGSSSGDEVAAAYNGGGLTVFGVKSTTSSQQADTRYVQYQQFTNSRFLYMTLTYRTS